MGKGNRRITRKRKLKKAKELDPFAYQAPTPCDEPSHVNTEQEHPPCQTRKKRGSSLKP